MKRNIKLNKARLINVYYRDNEDYDTFISTDLKYCCDEKGIFILEDNEKAIYIPDHAIRKREIIGENE